MDLGLGGKKALVTGGSRGIGRAIALELAREGADVAICARGAEEVDAAVAELRAHGSNAMGAAVDVADPDAFVSWVEAAADQLGGIDVLVANASALALVEGEEGWRRSYDVDVMHTVNGCDAARPYLAAGDGAIVIVSSVSAQMAALPPTQRGYGSLKAALLAYGAQLAQELAADGIRLNCVSPGAILFADGIWDGVRRSDAERFARVEGAVALGRLGSPDEVARAVVFLASPAASYVTGATLRVDGGVLKHVNF